MRLIETVSDLTQEDLWSLLDYDPAAGKMYWKPRSRDWFVNSGGQRTPEKCCANWNVKYAGKEAFTCLSWQGYLTGALLKKGVRAHRVIWAWMTGRWPDQIDHLNGNRADNRWVNLTECSAAGNSMNQKMHSNNKTGVNGVRWHKTNERYLAEITVQKKVIILGWFRDFEGAVAARAAADMKYGFSQRHGLPEGDFKPMEGV